MIRIDSNINKSSNGNWVLTQDATKKTKTT